jgi:hypothetical protein
MTQTALQDVVTTNVKVLMAVRRIEAQKDLAAQLGWVESKLTKSLRGTRKWSLDDLPELARVFGVTPADLIGDVTRLVNVARPLMTGTEGGVITGVSGRCPRTNPRVVIPFPQAGKVRRGYHSRRIIAAIKRGVRPETAPNTGHPIAVPVA